ncbi:DUF928 domain-containing protein [Nodularia sphaerocarpa]|uniref:DUF928 domain-containing protein n=1 Tax=Nodularia sphaerocarpa TaxID=137816 RepID=UPI001EFA4CF4|nr:DUF928 domain-containing protein [Nodularia sphaerocarpa]MDB9373342.1 DUF928 domain-containing protein [Nodularia sphaerocarpa CS-585]MDB9379735.1 DUF928 domain-containing protein [Nodularia sphaerocarpa CS-585A2]ULP71932.1 hypothetical protein BDGGKGIB_01569 [Nodularia sphaerocarpa UHCC 0038]
MKNLQLTIALGIAFTSNISYPLQLQALPINHHLVSVKFIPPPPPPDRSAAGSRSGAASRGCDAADQIVTALVPTYQQTLNQDTQAVIPVTQVWGLTNSENPDFFFFVPYKASSITNIEFVLQEQTHNKSKTLYRTSLTSPKSPGIISVHLPPSEASLQEGKMYHWFFKVRVQCDEKQPPKLDYADGWVQRVNQNSTLTEQIKQATLPQKATLYAANGVWYDAMMSLASLRLTNPQNETLLAQWTTLLHSVGLEEIANQPLINCCKPSLNSNLSRAKSDAPKNRS